MTLGRHVLQVSLIVLIHTQDVVVFCKVFFLDLTSLVLHGNSILAARLE